MRLYVLILALFVPLVGLTSYWAVFEAGELESKPENRRALIEAQGVRRGTITTVDGTVIAESVAKGKGNQRIYTRRYPTAELFGHPVGYSFVELGNSEIERSHNDVLTGESNEFSSILDQLRGATEEGSDLTVTLDADAQRTAVQALGGQKGAVVAIEPATGAVRAMVSVPGYDPNAVPGSFSQLSSDPDSPLLNRPTQSTYPPGSTMKVVTATAALDSGEFDPGTTLNAPSSMDISGVPLQNFGGQDFGTIDMTTALTNSVNTYWAQVAVELGSETMVTYMERYGFYSDPPLDFPGGQMTPSGVINAEGELVRADFDVGRVGIGQGGAEGELRSTVTQMAMVAAAVANGGKLMDLTFVQEVTDPDGRVTDELDPDVYSEVMSEETAAQLTEMMTRVATEGTASGLSVSGATLAGKTGTAEIDTEGLNQPWFIGFAPAEQPKIAVAATVERSQGGTGGEVAGPIVTAVMGALVD